MALTNSWQKFYGFSFRDERSQKEARQKASVQSLDREDYRSACTGRFLKRDGKKLRQLKNEPLIGDNKKFLEAQMSAKFSFKPSKVLIVDDDTDNLLFAQYAVESFSHLVVPLLSAHQVVSTALSCLPDVILLDIWLDGISGVEVFHRIRQRKQLSHIPIIAVTALAQPAERKRLLTIGFSDYLSKPYMLKDLEAILSRYLI